VQGNDTFRQGKKKRRQDAGGTQNRRGKHPAGCGGLLEQEKKNLALLA
jgi:hypothetical protein